MSNPDTVPTFDLTVFKESPFSLEFQAEHYNSDGTPSGTFFDLTGKTVRVHIAGVINPDLDFTSLADSPNGSKVTIESPATDGKILMYLHEDDLKLMNGTGRWYMQVEAPGTDEVIFMIGTFKVKSIETGS